MLIQAEITSIQTMIYKYQRSSAYCMAILGSGANMIVKQKRDHDGDATNGLVVA